MAAAAKSDDDEFRARRWMREQGHVLSAVADGGRRAKKGKFEENGASMSIFTSDTPQTYGQTPLRSVYSLLLCVLHSELIIPQWPAEFSFPASTAIDVLISVTMCYYLKKSKGKENRLLSRISALMVHVREST
ncbi:hypothetical protein C8J57DRAFT_1253778 [Mycena rebaudengoi]|nr:hypothetical protein C8J57DRAFT_1253778 [Mycena rebaudengoi]